MPLEVSARRTEPEVTVLEFTGELTVNTMLDGVEAKVGDLLAHGTNQVIFDLSRLEYMDSAGVGLVVFCFATVRDSGGSFYLASPNQKIEKVLHFTRLDSFLSIASTVDDAVQTVRNEKRLVS